MLIQKLRERVAGLFNRIDGGRFGLFGGRVVEAARDWLLVMLAYCEREVARLFGEGGTYREGVAFLRYILKGKLQAAIPWYARPFVSADKIVDRLCDYLLEIEGDVKGGIGELE